MILLDIYKTISDWCICTVLSVWRRKDLPSVVLPHPPFLVDSPFHTLGDGGCVLSNVTVLSLLLFLSSRCLLVGSLLRLALSCRVVSCRVLWCCVVLSCRVLSCLVMSCLSYDIVSSVAVLGRCLVWSCLD
jgi:hypothetical protein